MRTHAIPGGVTNPSTSQTSLWPHHAPTLGSEGYTASSLHSSAWSMSNANRNTHVNPISRHYSQEHTTHLKGESGAPVFETTLIPRVAHPRLWVHRCPTSPSPRPQAIGHEQSSDIQHSDRRGDEKNSTPQCAFKISMFNVSAIHINSRSSLRFSSIHEPSDPPLRIVKFSAAHAAF